MVGGFLGAGKTTAILQFARWLHETKRLKVGVVTNDQANGLVDTALADGARFVVREIGGGCFCCKSETLVEAMGSFSAKVQPQVLIGEPVGSCTDLVSTVLGPLRSVYRTEYELAPLSIVVDPFRAERIIGTDGATPGGFSAQINYIYRKQLEEAEIIVVNKSDVFERKRLAALCKSLVERYPKAEVMRVSARTGQGLEDWWEQLLTREHRADGFMPVDYQTPSLPGTLRRPARFGRGAVKSKFLAATPIVRPRSAIPRVRTLSRACAPRAPAFTGCPRQSHASKGGSETPPYFRPRLPFL